MKNNLSTRMAVLAFSVVVVSGCNGGIDLYVPDTVTHQKIQVQQDVFTQDVLLSGLDEGYFSGLARHYLRYGGHAPLDLVVTYDPRSYRNTAMHMTEHVAEIADTLRGYGVSNINSSILPVKDQGDEARVLVRYDMYTAHAAEDCDVDMPGMNSTTVHNDENYKMGCGIQSQIAKQIARPSDLLGRDGQGGAIDGRGPVNVIDLHRTGALNESLDGESASGE